MFKNYIQVEDTKPAEHMAVEVKWRRVVSHYRIYVQLWRVPWTGPMNFGLLSIFKHPVSGKKIRIVFEERIFVNIGVNKQ